MSRPTRLRARAEGEKLDLDAAIGAMIDYRAGLSPSPRVYETLERRSRDLSVLILLDISESTKDFVRGTTRTVLSVERAATVLLAEALADLGDSFAILAFCSNGREDVRIYPVKGFAHPYGPMVKGRLAGLRGGLSTRMGAALRHAGRVIAGQRSHRRLVLVVTDGEPSDIDVADPRYFVEDARKAIQTLAHDGIDVFAIGLDGSGTSYMSRIFGRRAFAIVDRIERLPEKLPQIYLRLTA